MQEMVADPQVLIFLPEQGGRPWAIFPSPPGYKGRCWISPQEYSSEVEPTEGLEPGGAAQPSARKGWVTRRSPSPGQLGWKLGDGGDAIPVPGNTKLRLFQ